MEPSLEDSSADDVGERIPEIHEAEIRERVPEFREPPTYLQREVSRSPTGRLGLVRVSRGDPRLLVPLCA